MLFRSGSAVSTACARALAQAVLAADPELTQPEHRGARAALEQLDVADREVVKEEAG